MSGKYTDKMIIVQTSIPESVNKAIEQMAAKEMLKRSDILRRWVMRCFKEERDKRDE